VRVSERERESESRQRSASSTRRIFTEADLYLKDGHRPPGLVLVIRVQHAYFVVVLGVVLGTLERVNSDQRTARADAPLRCLAR
jgi:hypothetical protein